MGAVLPALAITTPGVIFGGAQAQDAGVVQEDEESVQGVVYVTARKREENLQDVPVAISAFGEAQLEEQAITELGDLLDASPGMVYNERDGNRSTGFPGVRGVKTFTSPAASQQRISSFIDGMPMVGPQATIPFVDIQGAEVYRGPQSAVFGRSVFAGAVNYTTRKPSLDIMEGGFNAQYGEDGRQAASAWITAPLIEDKLGVLLSGSADKYDG
ncbi:unnamed protein product, partial [Chrysoparadoxa australica]